MYKDKDIDEIQEKYNKRWAYKKKKAIKANKNFAAFKTVCLRKGGVG